MPRPLQLLLNEFLTQESVFKKHLMEQIINLFEYTSNLIRGAWLLGQLVQGRLHIALGNPEWQGPGCGGKRSVCLAPPPSLPQAWSLVHSIKKLQSRLMGVPEGHGWGSFLSTPQH